MAHTTTHHIVSNADTIIYLKTPCERFAVWDGPAPVSPVTPSPTAPSPAFVSVEAPSPEDIEGTDNRVPEYKSKKQRKKEERIRLLRLAQAEQEFSDALLSLPPTNTIIGGGIDVEMDIPIFDTSVESEVVPEPEPSEVPEAVPDPDEPFVQDVILDSGQTIAPEVAAPAEIVQQDEYPSPAVELAPQAIEATLSSVTPASPPASPSLEPTTPDIEARQIGFRVCSGNLMSASPWFNRIFQQNGWMESTRNPEVHLFELNASDWDEEAFTIVMNVFHLRNRQVTRPVSLELLAKIAVLADYYGCNEALDIFVEIWISHLRETSPIPSVYGRDLILWVWISWAFQLPKLFKRATAVVIERANEPVRNLGLPIPAWVTDELDARRCRAIGSIVSGLEAQLQLYSDDAYSCPGGRAYSFRCGCMLLGALMKKMESLRLRTPQLSAPYLGRSFHAICNTTRTIESEVWYHGNNGHRTNYSYSYGPSYGQHSCTLSTAMASLVKSAIAGVEGISLKGTSD